MPMILIAPTVPLSTTIDRSEKKKAAQYAATPGEDQVRLLRPERVQVQEANGNAQETVPEQRASEPLTRKKSVRKKVAEYVGLRSEENRLNASDSLMIGLGGYQPAPMTARMSSLPEESTRTNAKGKAKDVHSAEHIFNREITMELLYEMDRAEQRKVKRQEKKWGFPTGKIKVRYDDWNAKRAQEKDSPMQLRL